MKGRKGLALTSGDLEIEIVSWMWKESEARSEERSQTCGHCALSIERVGVVGAHRSRRSTRSSIGLPEINLVLRALHRDKLDLDRNRATEDPRVVDQFRVFDQQIYHI